MTKPLGNTTELASGNEFQGANVHRFYLQSLARELLNDSRINICYRHKLPGRDTVEVMYSPERKRGRIHGTMKCKLAWTCAVCASYITERRREELTRALDAARYKYAPFLVTYTAQHSPTDTLKDTLSDLLESYRKMRSGRWWQTIKDEYSLRGSVRATEITYSPRGGWHPHFHEIVLVDFDAVNSWADVLYTQKSLQQALGNEWIRVLSKHGRGGKEGIALDVRGADAEIAQYVAKWGRLPIQGAGWTLAHEATKANVKKSRAEGLTPFEILWRYGDGDKRAGRLFREFSEATSGRSMLHWSRGTRELLDIDTVSDEIAAEGQTEDERLLATISAIEWRAIVRGDLQSKILQAAHEGDADAVRKIAQDATSEATQGVLSRFYCLACMVDYEPRETRYGTTVYVCPKCDHEIE